jgi:hypothetical protein
LQVYFEIYKYIPFTQQYIQSFNTPSISETMFSSSQILVFSHCALWPFQATTLWIFWSAWEKHWEFSVCVVNNSLKTPTSKPIEYRFRALPFHHIHLGIVGELKQVMTERNNWRFKLIRISWLQTGKWKLCITSQLWGKESCVLQVKERSPSFPFLILS